MIIVTGGITARPETFDEVLRLSTEHVLRLAGLAGETPDLQLYDANEVTA